MSRNSAVLWRALARLSDWIAMLISPLRQPLNPINPPRMFREQFLVDPRLVMESVEMRGGDQLHQISVAGLVLRQQGEMIGGIALVRRAVLHLARRHVRLATDDRFDPGFLGFLVKVDRAVEIAVVRNRDGRHAQRLRFFHQLFHPHRPIEEGVFGVEMEVDEGIGRHPTAL